MNCRSGKRRFESPAEASAAARSTAKNRSDGAKKAAKTWCGGPLRHYRCEWCHGWHIGHSYPSRANG